VNARREHRFSFGCEALDDGERSALWAPQTLAISIAAHASTHSPRLCPFTDRGG
jgi:hypothetical protein